MGDRQRESGGRLLTPAFVALTLSELAYFTALGMMIPVLPLFATEELDVGSVGVGFAVGAFGVTALLLRPSAGRLADRWGRRRLLLAAAALCTTGVAAHLLVTQFWQLVALRILLGVAEAGFFVAGMAALADLTPAHRLGEALSYNSLGLYLGITFGPAAGEALLRTGGYGAAWTATAALAGAAVLLATRLPPLPGAAERTSPGSMIPAVVISPGLAFVAGLSGAAGFLGFAALYARDLGMAGAGTVLFIYGAVVVVCRLLLARRVDRVPAGVLSSAALLACAGGLGLMGAVPAAWAFLGGAAVLAVGVALLTPAFFRILMSLLPEERRGTAAASFSIMVDLGLGGGPMAFGLIARPAGIPATMVLFAVLAAVAAVATARATARATAPAAHPAPE